MKPMLTSRQSRYLALCLLFALASASPAQKHAVRPAIVSPTVAADSLGETVYEAQGDAQKDVPAVPGVYVAPVATSTPRPKLPKTFKGRKSTEVTVDGIISQGGAFIDAKVSPSTDPDFAALALETVARYTFKPGTLDGKPVATLGRIVIKFRIF